MTVWSLLTGMLARSATRLPLESRLSTTIRGLTRMRLLLRWLPLGRLPRETSPVLRGNRRGGLNGGWALLLLRTGLVRPTSSGEVPLRRLLRLGGWRGTRSPDSGDLHR